MSLLEVENLALGYEGRTVAEGISFRVEKGDYLCVVGENGSGKSTLIKTLLGLNAPISGSIKRGDGLKAQGIGYLPQQTVHQRDFPASVKEIVMSGFAGAAGLRPFFSAAQKAAALDNMRKLGIENIAGRCYRELSGGQQQRVLLARALCAADKMLLLDEPVSGLDPNASEEMYSVIERLNKDGMTVIMISHDIAAALRYATHILSVGEEIFFGTAVEYREKTREAAER